MFGVGHNRLLQEAKLAGEEQGKVYLYVYLSQPKQYACVIKTIGDDKFIASVDAAGRIIVWNPVSSYIW